MLRRILSVIALSFVIVYCAPASFGQQLANAGPATYPIQQHADIAAPKVNAPARGGRGVARGGATQPANAPVAAAPTTAPAPIPGSIQASFGSRHDGFVQIAHQGNVDVLFQGDSITDGWRNRGLEVWTKYYGNMKAANFGIGGDQTQHVLWRMQNGEMDGITPKVVVLMIGTNNTTIHPNEEIAHGVELIVKYIRTKSPTTKVLLLAIFPRGRTMDAPQMLAINQINPMIKKLDDGKMVRYLDIGGSFLGHDANGPTTVPSEIMPDALHPNAAGYEIWAKAIQPLLTEMMK